MPNTPQYNPYEANPDSDSINLLSFGASQGGVKDASQCFDAAVARINKGSRGYGTIYVPPGIYRISANVTIPANVRLEFEHGAKLSVDSGKTFTIQSEQTISAQWFGATGDGTTDDSAAIQSALNASGSVVSFPEGTYKIATALSVPANTTLQGTGKGTVFTTTGTNNILEATSKNYISVQGITFYMNGTPTTNQRAIQIVTSSQVLITDCTFLTWYAGVNLQVCQKARIANCYFDDCAFALEDNGSFATDITGCVGETGRLPGRGDSHINCTRCRSTGNVWYVGAGSGASYTCGTHFYQCNHCYASNTVQNADYGALMEAHDADCDGCVFDGFIAYNCGRAGSAGISTDTSNYFTSTNRVKNFVISNCKVYGSGIAANGIGLFHGSHSGVIAGCMVENAGYHGLQISACSKINVTGGMFKNNSVLTDDTYSAINLQDESSNVCSQITVSGAQCIEDRSGGNRQKYAISVSDAAHTNLLIVNNVTSVGGWRTAATNFGASAGYHFIDLQPTNITLTGKMIAFGGWGTNNSASATTPGTVTKKIEVFDSAGASIGYLPVYDAIT